MRLTSDHDREGGDSWESMLTMPSSASPKSRQWVVIKVVVMVDIIIVGCQWSFLRPFVRWLSLVFRQSQTELENGHDLDTCLYLLNYKQCFGYFLFLHYAELESDWSTSHILHWHIPRLVGSTLWICWSPPVCWLTFYHNPRCILYCHTTYIHVPSKRAKDVVYKPIITREKPSQN